MALRCQQIPQRPRLPGDPGGHGRRATDRPVHPSEVVGCKVERQRGAQVVPLAAESVRQTGEATHGHADVQVRPLNVGRANPIFCRATRDDDLFRRYYLRR
jgi:hypothetical protein